MDKRDRFNCGHIIERLRLSMNYSVGDLCAGVCSRQLLEKIESGLVDTDIRFIKLLLSRLGKSPNKFDYLLSQDQLRILEMQLKFDESIDKKDGTSAKSILRIMKENIDRNDKRNRKEHIDIFYYSRNLVNYLFLIQNDHEKALEVVSKSLEKTQAGWSKAELSERLISTMELENMLVFIYLSLLNSEPGEAEARRREFLPLLDRIKEYIEKRIGDDEEKAMILPKVNWLQATFLVDAGQLDKAVLVAEEGLELLRRQTLLPFVLPLLEIIVKYGDGKTKKDSIVEYKEYYDVFIKLIAEYKIEHARDINFFSRCDRAGHYPDWEIIKAQRKMQNLKREDLIDGIYKNVETLSRVESGKQSPNRTTFPRIMKKLGLESGRTNAQLISTDYEAFELYRLVLKQLRIHKITEAENNLSKLEEMTSQTNERNSRAIRYLRCIIDNIKQVGTSTEEFQIIQNNIDYYTGILEESFPITKKELFRMPLIVEEELIAIISSGYEKIKKTENGASLLLKVLKTYENSAVDTRLNRRWYGFFLNNFSKMKKDIIKMKEAVTFQLVCNSTDGLEVLCSSLAVHQHKQDAEPDEEILALEESLILARFLKATPNIRNISNYISRVKRKTGNDIPSDKNF